MLQSCSNGAWSNSTCASGYTCSNGACTSSGTTGDGSSGSTTTTNTSTNNTTISTYSLSITASPNNFDITQGESILESLTVENNGEKNLTSVSLSISGINGAWYTITPSTVSLNIHESKTFTINFTIPINASVNSYSIIASVTSEHSDASDSATFTIRVLPSSETVQNIILPLYEDYISQLSDLENQIKSLKESGKNTTDLENILKSIKEKLNQTNSSLTSQDYFAASRFLDDVKALIDELTASIQEIGGTTTDAGSIIFIIVVVVIIIAVAVIAYIFIPRGKEYGAKDYGTSKNIIPKLGGEDKVDKIVEKIKNIKRKKGEQKYKYEFKR
jgi:hypothetical protein